VIVPLHVKCICIAYSSLPYYLPICLSNNGATVCLGEKHGTITARINDAVNFEVTTLRIDKVDQFGKYLKVELNVPGFLKGLGHQMD
jgi:hypothetical protein